MNILRPSHERGHAKLDWLESFHSFSFGEYHDAQHMGWGPLRVINEDWIQPDMGFGTHGHRDMEILTYVLSGGVAHKDSIGTGSTLRPGGVQLMSAGSGIRHSEFNPDSDSTTHMLQIWIQPKFTGTTPSYQDQFVSDDEKRGVLRAIVSPDGRDGSLTIKQDAVVFATLLDGSDSVTHALAPGRRGYVHIARGSARVNGLDVAAGDAVKVVDEQAIDIDNAADAEILVFDLIA